MQKIGKINDLWSYYLFPKKDIHYVRYFTKIYVNALQNKEYNGFINHDTYTFDMSEYVCLI